MPAHGHLIPNLVALQFKDWIRVQLLTGTTAGVAIHLVLSNLKITVFLLPVIMQSSQF